MLIVLTDVVLRAINPQWRIYGMLDYVELSLDWLFFLAIPLALFQKRIISVDLIDGVDPKGVFRLIGHAALLIILLICATQIIRPALDTLEWEERTLDLSILKFQYWIPIWLGIGLSCIACLWNIVDWVRGRT